MASNPTPNRLQVLSTPVLLFINGLPKFVFPMFTAALLLGGLFIGNGAVAGTLLALLGLILAWLLALSWNLLKTQAKLMRILVVLLTFGYAIGRVTGQLH